MPVKAGSERAFQDRVIGLARYYQWRVYHAPAGGKGGRVDFEQRGRGFPDLVLVKPPRLVVAELKTATGRVSPAQREWLDDLAAVPSVEAYLWRPQDLETIARILGPVNGPPDPAALAFAA